MALASALVLAGCSNSRGPVAPVAPPNILVPVERGAAPTPPDGAAANLTIPVRQGDGSYATVNRQLSPQATAWHLRAAFNVAALNCPDPQILASYNRILSQHRAELAQAHKSAAAQGGKEFDNAMTRVYNYFAQPPVLDAFCATTARLAGQAALWPKGGYTAAAAPVLSEIDQPFQQFYARYDAYRTALKNWQNIPSGFSQTAPAPQIPAPQAMSQSDAQVTFNRFEEAKR